MDIVEIPDANGVMGNPGDVVEVPADLVTSVIVIDAEQHLKERIDWWLDEGGDECVKLFFIILVDLPFLCR